MRRRLALLVLAGLAVGCSNRDRLNPLDPANRSTGGAPQGFVAIADDRAVMLSWSIPPVEVGLSVRLFRATGAVAAPESLVELPFGVTRFYDTGLANGTEYRYFLSFVLENGALSASTTDRATPGPLRAWVADYFAGSLERITPDGRRIAQSVTGQFATPVAIDVNADGRIWVCDLDGGGLWRVTPGLTEDLFGALQQPIAVAVDRTRGRVWVADQGLNALQSLDPLNPSAPFVDARNLLRPIDVGLDPNDGSAWVCERNGDRVSHIGLSGATLGSAVMPQPSRVAVDSATRWIWVTSLSAKRAVAFSLSGTPMDTLNGFAGPVGIAIDAAAGSIWVADTDGDRVIVYDRAGTERFRVTSLYQPLDLAIDHATGEAWVVQPTSGQVTRISADGRVLQSVRGFTQPYDIALYP